MISVGSGSPLVMIPGIQGRWEWMAPAVEALGRRHQVVTGSLAGEPGASRFEPDRGFDNDVDQVGEWFERAGLLRAAVCGVSYGGLVALRFAALRPERVTALVLVSTPGLPWQPDGWARRYVRAPRLLAPVFVARAPFRMLPEIVRAAPSLRRAATFSLQHLIRIASAPMSPKRMGARGRLIDSVDFAADARRVAAPTLVVTGEPGLDRVVAVESTRRYVDLIPGAQGAILPRTGHIGLVSRPDAFADLVGAFVEAGARGSAPLRPMDSVYD